MYSKLSRRAFSLIELSVVLVLLSLVVGGALTIMSSRQVAVDQAASTNNLDAIDRALILYRNAKGRLPCPAIPTTASTVASVGSEAATPGTCTGLSNDGANVVIGAIPTKALQIPDSMMYDAWGRRITYAVDKRITQDGAFDTYTPQNTSIGAISVKDSVASATSRTDKAIYVLLSHGVNGHGAYLKSGSRFSRASANADEQRNCHCDSATTADATAVNYRVFVTRSATGSATSSNDKFDDLLIYKTRAQLASFAELQTPPTQETIVAASAIYNPWHLFMSQYGASSMQVYSMLTADALTLRTAAEGMPTTKPSAGMGIGIDASTDGKWVSFSHETSGSDNLWLYKRDTTTGSMTRVTVGASPTIYAYGSSFNSKFSNDSQYLAVATNASPYFVIYKKRAGANDIWDQHFTATGLPAARTKTIAWSPDDKYIAVTEYDPVTHPGRIFYIYQNNAGTFALKTTQPTEPLGCSSGSKYSHGADFSPAYGTSPNVYYYLAITNNCNDGLNIYKIDTNPATPETSNFTRLAVPTAPSAALSGWTYRLNFSNDGKYLAVSNGDTSPHLTWLKKNPASDAWTILPSPVQPPSDSFGISFSPDSKYLFIGHDGGNLMTVYKVDSTADTLTKVTTPFSTSVIPSAKASEITFIQ